MLPLGPSIDSGYRGSRVNATRGVTLTMGVTGIQWSGDMDQLMSAMTKSLTQKK